MKKVAQRYNITAACTLRKKRPQKNSYTVIKTFENLTLVGDTAEILFKRLLGKTKSDES